MVKTLSLVSLAFFCSMSLSIENDASECKSPVPLTRIITPTLTVDTSGFLSKLENYQATHSPLEFEEKIAQFMIGFRKVINGIEAFQRGKWLEAFSFFEQSAQLPFLVEAKYLLGSMYLAGLGTIKDTSIGMNYLTDAMRQGSKRAELDLEKIKLNQDLDGYSFMPKNLALLRQVALGIEAWQRKDYPTANSLLHHSYLQDQNQVEITYLLGSFYFACNRPEWGLIFLQIAESKGYPPAAFDLGLRYYTGNGVAKNFKHAAIYFEKYPLDAKFRYHLGLSLWESLEFSVKEEGLNHIKWAKENGHPLAIEALSEGNIICLND